MEYILIILLIIAFFSLRSIINMEESAEYLQKVNKIRSQTCRLHDWSFNEKDMLQCTKCNYISNSEE